MDRPPIFMAHFAPKPAANAGDDARATAEKRIIGATLAGRRADAASCYDDYVVRTSAAGGVKVVVQFIILANGTVSDASIVAPPPVDERFGACLLEVVRSTRFAVAPERPPNLVTYPFRFTPGP